jgi:isovaleryl-CoA dehydrogenase
MLFANNLYQNGNDAQREKYLPGASSGSLVCGMCMSEPGAGTDVMGMSTTAKLSADQLSYTLNGSKMWITNGTIDGKTTGDVFLVYAKTSDGRSAKDLSAFLVEKGTPGFTLGSKINDKCGMRASMTGELSFNDVKISSSNLIGHVGGATLCMMRNLEIERIVLAAMSLGIARRCIEIMSRFGLL